MKTNMTLEKLQSLGYNPIHIIGDMYLIRLYSRNYRKFAHIF